MPTTVTQAEAGTRALHTPCVLYVITQNPLSLQDELTNAVDQVRRAAKVGDRRGILITRRSQSLFTIEASADVHYGTTLEKDCWHRLDQVHTLAPGERGKVTSESNLR